MEGFGRKPSEDLRAFYSAIERISNISLDHFLDLTCSSLRLGDYKAESQLIPLAQYAIFPYSEERFYAIKLWIILYQTNLSLNSNLSSQCTSEESEERRASPLLRNILQGKS
ncbi:MAG: hypothetical protein QXX99_06190 [Candidatus Bathyarchaeia archaeon]